MQIEHSQLSLIGGREENQDRLALVADEKSILIVVADGMGGHADGAKAAEVACETFAQEFNRVSKPVFDPQGFLHQTIGKAHRNLVKLGEGMSIESSPRATCVACIIQDGGAFWGHVGDSRIYHIRRNGILERTRDHSHVELLLQDGMIREDEMQDHPLRNFVECCLGGEVAIPGMSITNRKALLAEDVLLVCTDGLWSGLTDAEIGWLGKRHGTLQEQLNALGHKAVKVSGQFADNTSAIALRWQG